MSSLGSLISIMGAFFLLRIIWYSFVSSSPVVTIVRSSLEIGPRIPLRHHTFNELVRYY